jgi:hypothetical protein
MYQCLENFALFNKSAQELVGAFRVSWLNVTVWSNIVMPRVNSIMIRFFIFFQTRGKANKRIHAVSTVWSKSPLLSLWD